MAAVRLSRERLRRELASRGWNGVDLAERAGVSAATVSHAMKGHPVSSTTVRKLASALLCQQPIAGAEALLEDLPSLPSPLRLA